MARAPRRLCTAGRGRSVGRSSTWGAPARALRHQAVCSSRMSSESQARCQRAKSAYWMGRAGRAEGTARVAARHSSATS
jgi:hypothetical protein